MDLIAVRLMAGTEARNRQLSPETVVDVLWASALPGDQLEHIRARWGPVPGTVDVVLFHLSAGPVPDVSDPGFTSGPVTGSGGGSASGSAVGPPVASTFESALRLCRRALHAAPALTGWSVTPLGPPEMTSWVLA